MATALEDISGKKEESDTGPKTDPDQLVNDGPSELRMDSGLIAWMQVLGSWILFANTWFV